MRTSEMAVGYRKTQNVPKENDEDLDKNLVTSTLYCTCRDCKKYCAHKKPVTCIDPFLINMRHTYWIYRGLVTASMTQRAYMINTANAHQGNSDAKDNKTTIKENKTNKSKMKKKPINNNKIKTK
ncbi:unnamed protein product [Spodoptera exigua]|nr:unnamed protein product [Spodoptera exigua]